MPEPASTWGVPGVMREVCQILTTLDEVHAGRGGLEQLQPLLEEEGTEWSADSTEIFFPQRDSRLFLIPDM